MEDLGPNVVSSAEIGALAGAWLSGRGFEMRLRFKDDVAVVEARKASWVDTVTGRRKALVVRLKRSGDRWKGEATLADWRENLLFFAAGALLGTVGLGGASLSAASRLWDPDLVRDLMAALRADLADRAGKGPRLPE